MEERGFFFELRGIQACEFLGIYGSLHWIVHPGPQGNTFKIKMAGRKFQLSKFVCVKTCSRELGINGVENLTS